MHRECTTDGRPQQSRLPWERHSGTAHSAFSPVYYSMQQGVNTCDKTATMPRNSELVEAMIPALRGCGESWKTSRYGLKAWHSARKRSICKELDSNRGMTSHRGRVNAQGKFLGYFQSLPLWDP